MKDIDPGEIERFSIDIELTASTNEPTMELTLGRFKAGALRITVNYKNISGCMLSLGNSLDDVWRLCCALHNYRYRALSLGYTFNK